MKGHEGKHEKGDKDAWKAKLDACLNEKHITLTAPQQEALKKCHHEHHEHMDAKDGKGN
jgi:hypothetical protein